MELGPVMFNVDVVDRHTFEDAESSRTQLIVLFISSLFDRSRGGGGGVH